MTTNTTLPNQKHQRAQAKTQRQTAHRNFSDSDESANANERSAAPRMKRDCICEVVGGLRKRTRSSPRDDSF